MSEPAFISPRQSDDARRRKCLYRAWHRGTREMDLIMGPFAEAHLTGMSETDLTDFESLIDVPDRELFSWISGSEAIPAPYDLPVLQNMIAFHHHKAAIHR
jgi:antitoxin CptB